MGLVPTFTKATVAKAFAERRRAIYRAVLNNLAYVGELCVNHARSVRSYQDQTGNLRNSIGYVIVYNGRVVRNAFQKSASVTVKTAAGKSRKTKGSGDGVTIGRELALELAGEHTSGWALIVVAGMDYASTVESRGLDVLTSAEQLAATELPNLLAALKADIAKIAKPV